MFAFFVAICSALVFTCVVINQHEGEPVTAYYNEIDRFAAAWLRELIKRNLIAPGEVDERSITDVRPDELVGFTQVHFFAGIGVWSYALRQAGWPDDRPVWTGSCPCQPFSCAGKGAGFDDSRHLWPEMFRLIAECRPVVVLGEQVASKDGLAWYDAVQVDLEGAGYASGAVDTCAAGLGAPHIRQRLYWMAHAESVQRQHPTERVGRRDTSRCCGVERLAHAESSGSRPGLCDSGQGKERRGVVTDERGDGWLDNPVSAGPQGQRWNGDDRDQPGRDDAEQVGPVAETGATWGMADAYEPGLQPWERDDQTERYWHTVAAKSVNGMHGPTSPTNGHWRDADWLFCRDGKWRPVESGTFPLVTGAPARVVRLRGYGNSIVAPVAQAFIEAVMEEMQVSLPL